MDWQEIKRTDYLKGSDKPFITLRPSSVAFNAEFTKKAELSNYKFVSIHTTKDNPYFLGFQFHNDPDRPGGLTLYTDSKKRPQEIVQSVQ